MEPLLPQLVASAMGPLSPELVASTIGPLSPELIASDIWNLGCCRSPLWDLDCFRYMGSSRPELVVFACGTWLPMLHRTCGRFNYVGHVLAFASCKMESWRSYLVIG